MPRIIGESFNESEAANNITVPESNADAVKGAAKDEAKGAANGAVKGEANKSNNANADAQETVGVMRRRRGRRVTRGTGAAGEAMELKVEDPNSQSGQSHFPVRSITSLLFQEPVLPTHANNRDDSGDRGDDGRRGEFGERDERGERGERNSRGDARSGRGGRSDSRETSRETGRSLSRQSGRNATDERDESDMRDSHNSREDLRDSRDTRDDTRDSRDGRRRRRGRLLDNDSSANRSRQSAQSATTKTTEGELSNRQSDDNENSANVNNTNVNNVGIFDDDIDFYRSVDDIPRKSQRSRRSRRLNAVERRAAAEVEQIEEDLAYDDIVYAPIDTRIDETLDVSDIVSNRRRNRSNRNDVEDDEGLDNRESRNERNERNDRNERNERNDRSLRRRRQKLDMRDDYDNDTADDLDDTTQSQSRNTSFVEDDEESGMMTRRRRRHRASRTGSDDRNDRNDSRRDSSNEDYDDFNSRVVDENLDAVSQEDRDLIPDPDEFRAQDEEETLYTRRRRRRRTKTSDDATSLTSPTSSSTASRLSSDDDTSRRSRKQQYIDEITDIEGSTRLEAKRQRRRDNRRERSRQNLLIEQDFLARRENVERLMVVRERDKHTQISVIEDNILVEHYVSDIQEVATVGNIYLGRIQNVLPSMEAAFVDIGQARNGVLYAGEVNWDMTRLEGQPRRIELAFKSGDPVLVQVTKDPIGHKGARLTSQVTLAGRFLVLVPSGGMTGVSRKLSDRERSRLRGIVSKIAPKDMGIIIRTAAEGASEDAISKDLESLVKQWERIESKRQEYLHGKRPKLLQGEPDVAIRVVRDIFNDDFQKLIVEGAGVYQRIDEYLEMMAPDLRSKVEYWDPAEHEGKDVFDKWQIDSQLRKGMERQVYLPAGGSIVIDRTEAMTTIDVNTGRFIGRGKSLEETVTRCNLEASEEIARQLRLRDIGGMVMIDYVDMVMPANRDLVLRRLLECLARDRTKHQVAEVTSLGLVQMTRKRVGQGLVEAFSEECPMCKGRGFILHDEPTVSSEYADPYALKGGDPFVKTNKYGHGSATEQPAAPVKQQGSSADVRAKLARIAAASVVNDGAKFGEAKLDEATLDEATLDEATEVAEDATEVAENTEAVAEVAEVTENISVNATENVAENAYENTDESSENTDESNFENTDESNFESTNENTSEYTE